MLCSEASEQGQEPLAGTAAFATTWILVEEPGVWAPTPLDSPGIAPHRSRLERWLSEFSDARLQLIRRADRLPQRRRIFFAEPIHASLRYVECSDLDEIDIASLKNGTLGKSWTQPLWLVCTHGKRDRCCALHGSRFFQAMEAIDPEHVWQTSHLGGHRFAATVLNLPGGYCWGRVVPEDAPSMLHAERIQDFRKIRGRVCYPPAVQAADIQLRRDMNLSSDANVQLCRVDHNADGWRVYFDIGSSRRIVRVRIEVTEKIRPTSCGGEEQAIQYFHCKLEGLS